TPAAGRAAAVEGGPVAAGPAGDARRGPWARTSARDGDAGGDAGQGGAGGRAQGGAPPSARPGAGAAPAGREGGGGGEGGRARWRTAGAWRITRSPRCWSWSSPPRAETGRARRVVVSRRPAQ